MRKWGATVLCLAGFVLVGSVLAADPDPYLEELEEEAGKVDSGRAGDGGSGKLAKPGQPDTSRKKFESELKERYAGSYVFYKKMPNRAQEEVFADYKKGASIDEIRRMIVARFLETAK